MNVFSLLETTLDQLGIPHVPEVYKGPAKEYVTYNYSDERPELSGDDGDIYDVTTVQVHYWTRGDPHLIKSQIRQLLKAAGFSIVSVRQLYDDESGARHVVVEAEIESKVED
jgi:hypothetical protein